MIVKDKELRIGSAMDAFIRELGLVRIKPQTFIATWVEDDGHLSGGKLKMQRIEGDALGEPISVMAVSGIPASPKVCGKFILWVEFKNASGTLIHADLDVEKMVVTSAGLVELLRDFNCGDFACANDAQGRLWVLCETWKSQTVTLRTVVLDGEKWKDIGELGSGGICSRPRLVCDDKGVMAAWDEFIDGSYSACTAKFDISGVSKENVSILPKLPNSWETLVTIGKSHEGTWYAARCRERVVQMEHGEAGHCTSFY